MKAGFWMIIIPCVGAALVMLWQCIYWCACREKFDDEGKTDWRAHLIVAGIYIYVGVAIYLT